MFELFKGLIIHFVLTMKKRLLLALFIVSMISAIGQTSSFTPKLAVKWAPTGLILGSISLHGEYNFGPKKSLTAKMGIPANTKQTFEYEGKDAEFMMKATSFLAGYRMYFSKKQLRGLYLEPFFKYVHHTSEGIGNSTLENQPAKLSFSNDYNAFGVGAQLGAQFLIKDRFIIDLFFLGPEINTATNRFKAVEITNTIPWTSVQSSEAESDIRDFINHFPFVRNKTEIMVDKDNKTVTADFKGVIPGYRAGISFGIRF